MRRAVLKPWLTGLACFAILAGVLLAGFLPLFFIGDMPVAGVLQTGQAEPMRWAVPALPVILLAGWRMGKRRAGMYGLAAAGTMAVLLFCALAGRQVPVGGAVALALVAGGGLVLADGLRRRRWPVAAAGLAAVILSLVLTWPDRSGGKRDGSVGVISALPLFWSGTAGADILDRARTDPLIAASGWTLRPVDTVDAASLSRYRRLLLIQPRLLQPSELVALDAWVRAGGHVLIFADPLLLWPSEAPPGDPARPPLTSLLDPLMRHWGLELDAAPDALTRPYVTARGHVLFTQGASRFISGGHDCALEEGGLLARCVVGAGSALWVADADMLYSANWLADPDRPSAVPAWTSDAVPMMDGWLAGKDGEDMGPGPNRITGPVDVTRALRWALLWICANLFWCIPLWMRPGTNWDRPGEYRKTT